MDHHESESETLRGFAALFSRDLGGFMDGITTSSFAFRRIETIAPGHFLEFRELFDHEEDRGPDG